MIRIRPFRNLLASGSFLLLAFGFSSRTHAQPLRIMPLGDSITAGYTDNPPSGGTGGWTVPFEFGYRRQLYHLLETAGYDFVFCGQSQEPFVSVYGDPTHGGTVSPTSDLRNIDGYNYDGHRGYGGRNITTTNSNIAAQITADSPDVILLMIGINGISVNSAGQLDTLVTTIFSTKPTVRLIVAEITPYGQSTVEPYATRNPIIVSYNTYIRDVLVPKFLGQGRSISRVNQHRHFLSDPNNPSSATITALYSNSINHPTNAAYDTMAGTWFEGIQSIIPAPAKPLLNENEFPADISQGTSIGNLTHTPPPAPESVTYGFAAGPGDADNSKFIISGNQLQAGSHNFAATPAATYRIRIKATGATSGIIGNAAFILTSIPEDNDGDGIPDLWELTQTGSGNVNNGNLNDLTAIGDFDQDGLDDIEEYLLSIGAYPDIDPTQADTDSDGLSDKEEIDGAGQRPPTNPTLKDTDGDDVCDFNEDNTGTYVSILQTGTNPTLVDSDGDTLGDGVEILQNTSPVDIASPPPATLTTASSATTGTYVGSVSTADLLHGLTGANALATGWYFTTRANPAKLNDGIHGGYTSDPVDGGWADNTDASVITYTLPVGSGNGWDLTNITTIADWSGAGFGNQHYDVAVLRMGQADFTALASVNYQPLGTGAGGTRVQITRPGDLLTDNVLKVRFTMLKTIGTGNRAVYRELDVFGTQSGGPPAVLPEVPLEVLAMAAPSLDKPQASITWRSYPGKTYRVETSEGLDEWAIFDPAFPSGGVTTTFRKAANTITEPQEFYRVSVNP